MTAAPLDDAAWCRRERFRALRRVVLKAFGIAAVLALGLTLRGPGHHAPTWIAVVMTISSIGSLLIADIVLLRHPAGRLAQKHLEEQKREADRRFLAMLEEEGDE